MAKRRNPKRVNDPALDLITGRIVLASESVRKQFEQRLLTAIAEIGIGPHSEEAIANVVREYLRIYEPILADNLGNSLILTWLASYVESVSELPPQVQQWVSNHNWWRDEPPEIPGLFGKGDKSPPEVRFPKLEKAAESLFKRGILTRPQYDQLDKNAKQLAFTVAKIDDTAIIGKIRDALGETVREGATLEKFREKVEGALGKSPVGSGHLENIFRTGIMSAFRDGAASLSQNPIVREIFRYREFSATHDGRVRDEHLAFETYGIGGGPIYREDDPLWDFASPPLGYNCRCVTSLLSIRDAARMGVGEAKRWLESGRPPENPEYCVDKVKWRPTGGFGVRHGDLLSTA